MILQYCKVSRTCKAALFLFELIPNTDFTCPMNFIAEELFNCWQLYIYTYKNQAQLFSNKQKKLKTGADPGGKQGGLVTYLKI